MTTAPPFDIAALLQNPAVVALAQALASQLPASLPQQPQLTVGEAARDYLKAIRHHRSWKSKESRWRLHILPKLGSIPVRQLRASQVEALLAEMKDKDYSQQTLRHVRVTLGAFYEWLKRDDVVQVSPIDRVKGIPVPEGNPKALSKEEVHAIARAATFEGLRRFILLLFYTACRPGELLAATWADFDLERAQLHVRRTLGSTTTKTGKSRIVEIPGEAVALLRQWREEGEEIIFRNASGQPLKLRRADRAFKSALRRAGVLSGWKAVCRRKGCGFKEPRKPEEGERCPRCRFLLFAKALPADVCLKDMRSSCITYIVEKTGDMRAGQLAAGHSSMATTERHYAKKRQEHLRRRIDEAFPLPLPEEG